jgi:ssRNA-specific RNase YbeY (16S rRNA maturation enzyme)
MEKYKTSDLYFASFLKCVGVALITTEIEGKKISFVFEDKGTIKELKKQYFNREATVPALNFVDEIRSMKALTYMSKEGE